MVLGLAQESNPEVSSNLCETNQLFIADPNYVVALGSFSITVAFRRRPAIAPCVQGPFQKTKCERHAVA